MRGSIDYSDVEQLNNLCAFFCILANNEGIRNTLTWQFNGCKMLLRVEMADFSHYLVLIFSCKRTQRKLIIHRAEKLHLGTFELRCNESTAKRFHLLTLQGSLSTFLNAVCDDGLVQSGSLGPACLILCRSTVASPMSWQRCPIFSVASPVRTDISSTPLNTARGAREQHFAWSFMAHAVLAWTMTCHCAKVKYTIQRAPPHMAETLFAFTHSEYNSFTLHLS